MEWDNITIQQHYWSEINNGKCFINNVWQEWRFQTGGLHGDFIWMQISIYKEHLKHCYWKNWLENRDWLIMKPNYVWIVKNYGFSNQGELWEEVSLFYFQHLKNFWDNQNIIYFMPLFPIHWLRLVNPEGAVRRCSSKQVFLKISHYSTKIPVLEPFSIKLHSMRSFL